MTVVVNVTPTGSATGYVVDRESMIDRPGADDDGGFVIHVEGVPSSVPPTVVVLAVGSGLRKIVERGGFLIHWSEMDGSDSQYDGYIRLQTDERDEEDEEERQRE